MVKSRYSPEQVVQPKVLLPSELEFGDRVVINTVAGSGYVFETAQTKEFSDIYGSVIATGSLFRMDRAKATTADNLASAKKWAQLTGGRKSAVLDFVNPLEVGRQAVFSSSQGVHTGWRTSPLESIAVVKHGQLLNWNSLTPNRDSFRSRLLGRLALRPK